MLATIGFIMIIIIVIVLMSGKVCLPPIFVIIPTIAALIAGFSMKEITGMVNTGLSQCLGTAVLFVFAISYFSILSEVGMFDVIVNKVMKFLSNKIEVLFWITCFVAFISHLDGSGATTMLVTIPMMLPLYLKMKVSRTALVLISGMAAGCMNMNPWCSSVLRVATATAQEPMVVWKHAAPMQIAAFIFCLILCVPIARLEKKRGAGMNDEEFAEMKKDLLKPVEVKVPHGVLIFDIILTVVLIVILLTGVINSNFGFMIAFVIMIMVNCRTTKEQVKYIKQVGGNVSYMVMMILSIGVMVGILKDSGMMNAMVEAILSVTPKSMGTHIPFVVALLSAPLSMMVGSDTMYMAIAPILGGVVTEFGVTILAMDAACLLGSCLAAQLCLVGPTPYLALGLADVEMRDSLKYSFGWVWLLTILSAIVGAIAGVFPF